MFIKKKLHEFRPTSRFFFNVHLDGMRETHDRCIEREGVFDTALHSISHNKFTNVLQQRPPSLEVSDAAHAAIAKRYSGWQCGPSRNHFTANPSWLCCSVSVDLWQGSRFTYHGTLFQGPAFVGKERLAAN